MGLQELQSTEQVQQFLRTNAYAVVTFSAHWCGPCRQSKPALEQLAAASSTTVPFAICYEDKIDVTEYNVRAFPTYILFARQQEQNRVEGANLAAVQQMIAGLPVSSFVGTGSALGGGTTAGGGDARSARLVKLGGASAVVDAPATTPMDRDAKESTQPAAAEDTTDMDVEPAEHKESPDDDKSKKENDDHAPDPTAQLDPQALETLTQEMGFTLLRAQKGLLYGNSQTVESAVDWITEHQEDDDIDEPITAVAATNSLKTPQSYKCNECGKVLSNMANLELHANKTGHSDFEESTQHVKPLSAEEKKAKIAEIKNLLKAKRAEREEIEKAEEKERERQRRMEGKNVLKTREELDREQRKREAQLRQKEKQTFERERARLRAELAKDKAERAASGGKLSSRLGVDGYNPDGIQYDVDDGTTEHVAHHAKKKAKADASKIDDYIKKVSSYRAGGDGGNCLKILKAYVGNVVDNPTEAKFKTINTENKAFLTKVKPFIGARSLLMAVGFQQQEGSGTALVLQPDADMKLLAETKAKLEKAMAAYG